MVDGILNVDKPGGVTSFSVVATVKRLSGERRVGHAGTLDPAATGVLPICLGQGTRIVEFLSDGDKTYRARIELGVDTDTYDACGNITREEDPSSISREQLEAALAPFRGLIQQTPPMYSAVKYQGQPLYKLARSGIQIERKSRPVSIYRLEIVDWQPPLATIEIDCGKGTYIRSLAHDLGQALGCGAHLKDLVRLRYGIFDIKDALSLPRLEDAFHYGYWLHFVQPLDAVLPHWSAMVVNETTENTIRKGCSFLPESGDGTGAGYDEPHCTPRSPAGEFCRAYTLDGRFLSVLRLNPENGCWHPDKVFK